jgi:hypothetical protein
VSRELTQNLVSPDQVQSALLDLETYRQARAEAGLKSKTAKAAEAEIPDSLAGLLTGELTEAHLDEVRTWLKALQAKAPVIHIGLPGVPSEALRRALAHWFRERIDPTILLDFEVDRELAGGFVLRVGGQLYDYSFRKRLLDKKAVIARIYHGQ